MRGAPSEGRLDRDSTRYGSMLGTGAWTAACSASIIMAAGEGCEGSEVDFPDEMMAAA